MKTALFTNFSDETFVGYWDGKGKSFEAGQSVYMPDYLAEHFARHLTNRELLRKKPNGDFVHPNGDKFVSPKRPEEVPQFMALFNKAFIPDDAEQLGDKKDDIDTMINVANKNRKEGKSQPQSIEKPTEESTHERPHTEQVQDPTKPQVIIPPDFDDDDDEDTFEGKPVDEAQTPPQTEAVSQSEPTPAIPLAT